MIRTLIIEDDQASGEYLVVMLRSHFPDVEVLEVVDSIPIGIDRVKELKPDLIFLDIELPPFTGFKLLEATRGMSYHTIFTTNFNKYATKAFKFSAVHYLEKPFGADDLLQAMSFYKERVGYSRDSKSTNKIDTLGKQAEEVMLHNLKEPQEKHIIGFPVSGGIEFRPIKNIVWCKADSHCSFVHLLDEKKLLVMKPLKTVENLLDEHDNFFRIHQSNLINVEFLVKYVREGEGDGGHVEMVNGEKLNVSRSKREAFLNYLKKRGVI